MATDNFARSMAASKLSKKGGVVDGNLSITGNLNVNGTTVTKRQETLMVKDNMLVTNSDGANLSGLSGVGIRNGPLEVYGVVYDKLSQSVKLGIGSLDSDNNFKFDPGEGCSIATRDEDSLFTNGHYAKWDSTNNKFVDGGIAVTKSVFGIHQNDGFKKGQVLYCNTNVPLNSVIYFLSKLDLTFTMEIEGRDVHVGGVLFEDEIDNSEGIYFADLSVLGGTGYIVFTAEASNDIITRYVEPILLTDVTDQNNESVIQQIFPNFALPTKPGWIVDNITLTTNIKSIIILRFQSDHIVDQYSKYVTNLFALDNSLWNAIQVMIDCNSQNIPIT